MEYAWTVILSILVGTLGVYYWVYRNVKYFKKKGVPYIEATPLVGNIGPHFSGKLSMAENFQRLYNAHPNVKYVGVLDFMNPVVMLRDPELIKSVTIKNFDSFQDHEEMVIESLDPLIAKNLVCLQGERWRNMRSLLSPAFTSSKIKMMFKLVSQCGIELADYLAAKASQPIDLEMKDPFGRYTNDVIATTAFGISVNSLRDQDNDFFIMGKEATDFSGINNLKSLLIRLSPFFSRLFKVQILSDKVNNFFNHVIGSTVATRDEKGIVRSDMIQLMMQARDKSETISLTTEDMAAHALIFLLGGFDTSSTLMCFVAHEVGTNPTVQEKLQAEIDAVLAEGQGELTYEALQGMRYLDAVINETLRIYPPFPSTNRICTKSFELPPAAPGYRPFTVKAGSTIWLPIYAMHRDPQYFPDPEKFDPERFSEENKVNIPPFAYFPFGLGPRICIGNRFALMEVKLAIFHLFAKCNLSPCSKTSIPIQLHKQTFNTTAENGFWMTIQRRS